MMGGGMMGGGMIGGGMMGGMGGMMGGGMSGLSFPGTLPIAAAMGFGNSLNGGLTSTAMVPAITWAALGAMYSNSPFGSQLNNPLNNPFNGPFGNPSLSGLNCPLNGPFFGGGFNGPNRQNPGFNNNPFNAFP